MTEADIEAKLALIREEIKTLSPAEREAILASPEPEALSAIEPETIAFSELLLLSLEQRFGRLCTSLETTAKAATAGANNIEALTAQVTRLADALDAVSNTLGCITESVKGEDGEYRCFVRTLDRSNQAFMLAQRDERDTDED